MELRIKNNRNKITRGAGKKEEYEIGDNIFKKVFLEDGVIFLKNQRKLTLCEWNEEINRFQGMALLERHPNPLKKSSRIMRK